MLQEEAYCASLLLAPGPFKSSASADLLAPCGKRVKTHAGKEGSACLSLLRLSEHPWAPERPSSSPPEPSKPLKRGLQITKERPGERPVCWLPGQQGWDTPNHPTTYNSTSTGEELLQVRSPGKRRHTG